MAAEVAVPRAGGGRELATRVVVGAGLVAAALGATLAGGVAFCAMIALVSGLTYREWQHLTGSMAFPALIVAGFVLAITVDLGRGQPDLLWFLLAVLAVRFVTSALMTMDGQRDVHSGLVGMVYVGCAALALAWLRSLPMGEWLVLIVFAVVWGGDIGAFVVGRSVRGPRLWPSVSPGKTWAGLVGAVLGALALSNLVFLCIRVIAWSALEDSAAYRVAAHANWAAIVAFALIGVSGDLFESALKRRAGVKDSGNLLPGHGGVLDRIDSLIMVAPAVAAAVALGWL